MKHGVGIIKTLSRREAIRETLHAIAGVPCRCPLHPSCPPTTLLHSQKSHTDSPVSDYAYEISSCNVRVGKGVTKEVGMDFVNRGVKRILLFTDNNLLQHLPFSAAVESIRSEKLEFEVFSEVRVEPTDDSLKEAIKRAQQGEFDGFLAVGGGSVMDTAKIARLFNSYRDKDFLDFVNKPFGKGEQILRPLKPLICIPTTSGTGSEMTGVAIFILKSMGTKTALVSRALCPTLAIVDPLNVLSLPKSVAIYSGIDVLCSALESYTALPYYNRKPIPLNPMLRPPSQGSNPISDIWAMEAIKLVDKYLFRAVDSTEDVEACEQMSFAAMLGGVGFSNAGVHLCHGISYGISGFVKKYSPVGYPTDHPIIPHGLSVVMTAPAVFREVGHVCPDRCKQLAALMGANTDNVRNEDAGRCLSDQLCSYMQRLDIPNGLSALGFSTEDIPRLVDKTLLHKRQTDLSPSPVTSSSIGNILFNSMTVYN